MHTITLYVAGRDTPLKKGPEPSVAGHMWYTLNRGDGSPPKSYGFGPVVPKTLSDPFQSGQVIYNDNINYQSYQYSRTIQITQDQLNDIERFASDPTKHGFDMNYRLHDNSCVDFFWKSLEAGGLNSQRYQGSLIPTNNTEDLRRFVDSSPVEIARLNRFLKELSPLTWQDPLDADFWADQKNSWNRAKAQGSPLTLDLDGDGVETTALTGGVYFDHNADGFAEATGWAGRDVGLMVRDLDGNGRIDSRRELFGDQTLRTSGQTATNGFEALIDLDSNADNAITSADTAFASLRVWKDLDSDVQTDAGELLSLAEAGAQRIQLAYTERGTAVAPDAQGKQHRQTGTYTTTSGTTRSMNDVWFDMERWDTQDQLTPVAVSNAMAALPNINLPGSMGRTRTVRVLGTVMEQFYPSSKISMQYIN